MRYLARKLAKIRELDKGWGNFKYPVTASLICKTSFDDLRPRSQVRNVLAFTTIVSE